MIVKRTFFLNEWINWDHDLHQAVIIFRKNFPFYPNIMLASELTYAKINMIASQYPENIEEDNGSRTEKGTFIQLTSFTDYRGTYELDFCIDNKLAEKEIVLIFDSDPDSKEPIPEKDSEKSDIKQLIKKAG